MVLGKPMKNTVFSRVDCIYADVFNLTNSPLYKIVFIEFDGYGTREEELWESIRKSIRKWK
jgi:hypothetical protein